MKPIIEFKNVTREYGGGGHKLRALDNATFSINEGEFVVVLGPSGAGKSTVLNLLGGMDHVTSGNIVIDGKNITSLNDNELTEYRAKNVGFVFQFYNLIPTLTALENVALTGDIVKNPIDAIDALRMVDLADNAAQFPSQLSGGEQQRVSIARAIAKNSMILLCDEPTGALDSETGITVLSMLRSMTQAGDGEKRTVVIVTHNAALTEAADRVIRMRSGKIREIYENESPIPISEVAW